MNSANYLLQLLSIIKEQLQNVVFILQSCKEKMMMYWVGEDMQYISIAFENIIKQLQSQINLCQSLAPKILARPSLFYR
ncbi:MAG: hypothetical protein K2L08_00425 [Erysipelotrichaceae bacterium]|nr:hypothetical protein [Erysipelotrichaceae bacterium]